MRAVLKLAGKNLLNNEFHKEAPRWSVWLVLGFLLGAGFLSGCSSVSRDAANLVGHRVPDARLMLLSGDDLALKEVHGRNRALLFWTTWCSHSRGVISGFEDLARTYAPRGDTDFFAVSLDRNEDLDAVKRRIQAQDLATVTHVFSGNDVQDEAFLALKGDHVPYAVFIDDQSIVRFVGLGIGALEEFFEGRYGPN
jgi:hypothetical protein